MMMMNDDAIDRGGVLGRRKFVIGVKGSENWGWGQKHGQRGFKEGFRGTERKKERSQKVQLGKRTVCWK